MGCITTDPLNGVKPNRRTPDFSGLEAALRDACAPASAAAHPLAIMLQLYRSVRLAVLLDKVLDSLSELARDPKLPVRQALVVQRTIQSLSAAARRGRIAMRP